MHNSGRRMSGAGVHVPYPPPPVMEAGWAPFVGEGAYPHRQQHQQIGVVMGGASGNSKCGYPLGEVANKVGVRRVRRGGLAAPAAAPAGPVDVVGKRRKKEEDLESRCSASNIGVGKGGGGGGEEKLKCQFFLRTGTCAFGNRCKYFHPKDHRPPQLNVLGYPLRPGDKACSFYLKTGWCAFGATCKFHHPPPECPTPPVKMVENQPPPADAPMAHPPPAPYPHNVMGMMQWSMVPNIWYHPAVCSGQMMAMPPTIPVGAAMQHPPMAAGWRAPKSLKTKQPHFCDQSSRSNIEKRGNGEVEGVSSESSDGTYADLEDSYTTTVGSWGVRMRC